VLRIVLSAAVLASSLLPACGDTPAAHAAEQTPPASPPTAPPPAWFADVTAEAGVRFTHVEGDEQWDIRPTMGPGLAWSDVQADGWQDLYVVGGSAQDGALFVSHGRGREGAVAFVDETAARGLSGPRGAGMGASFADWDDDGDEDLYVTRDGGNTMWRNDAGSFTDVTEAAGTRCGLWSASVGWADVDRDGDLDLFVTNYLQFDLAAIPPESARPAERREDPIAMLPYVFPAQPDVLYRNEDGRRFTDVSAGAGLAGEQGKGLGVVFFDHDEDGWPDAYVADDTTPNQLWRNLGSWPTDGEAPDSLTGRGGFEDVALQVGLDDPRGGMGVQCADVDDDADEDIFVSYWQTEPDALYRNNARHGPSQRRFMPRYEDIAIAAGIGAATVGYVGWGCALADLDGDGDHDLCVTNGYTSPDYETTMQCVGQTAQLFENVTPPGALVTHRDVPRFGLAPPARAGAHFARPLAGRGLAACDYDADGDLDLALSANNGPLVLLRNERGGRTLTVVPEGDGKDVPREAVGAQVTLTLDDGSVRTAFVHRDGSYLSGHERGVRFGLGARQAVEVSVRWPDGKELFRPLGPGEGEGRLVIRRDG
jgi:enediyne biosynthesis protein E4